jgi:gas vesicle protein
VSDSFFSDLLGTLIGAALGTAGGFLVANWQSRKSRRDAQVEAIKYLPTYLDNLRALDPKYTGPSKESGRSDVADVTKSVQHMRATVRDVLGRVPDEVRAHPLLDRMLDACGLYLYRHDEFFRVPEAGAGSAEQGAFNAALTELQDEMATSKMELARLYPRGANDASGRVWRLVTFWRRRLRPPS